MKKVLLIIFVFASARMLACAGYWEEGMDFYNLFLQTNISAEEYYPFLRSETSSFYQSDDAERLPHKGNVNLWNEILKNWEEKEIHNAVYNTGSFDWSQKQSNLEQRAKTYIDFAQECSEAFSHRSAYNTWNYDEILTQKTIDSETLLAKASSLLKNETNEQLKARYYYQIIRALHYSKNWEEAIRLFELKIENKLVKNEIYYYILDQVAGCYYSTEQYEKSAYLFTKVINNSYDKKESAFLSFNFCSQQGANGKPFFKGIEDEKDLLLMQSLTEFSDKISNINKFIALDPNDPRVELLFIRALNNVERKAWSKGNGVNGGALPSHSKTKNIELLLANANEQLANEQVSNQDFWQLASSYLSFINNDIALAESKLNRVNSFPDQKKKLSVLYEVFKWDSISPENEAFIVKHFKNKSSKSDRWEVGNEHDFQNIVFDKLAHTYYDNNQIAKAFLIHNFLEQINNLNSLELLNDLEKFYLKTDKSEYEKSLIASSLNKKNFMDYLNNQKGIYYLYHKDPKKALSFFEQDNSYASDLSITDTIFSNNTLECFGCHASDVMEDKVHKAKLFSFIQSKFSKKELASYLVELQNLTNGSEQWKAKLANYLLGNYYYNISNSGYYRGLLNGNTNSGHYIYFSYSDQEDAGANIIANRSGYNLSNVSYYEKRYFGLSDVSAEYYQKVIDLSDDKELNARCLFLIAKCELNDFYNNGGYNTYELPVSDYYKIKLPKHNSFDKLKANYSETKFHQMIINECSYFKYYSANY